MKRIMVLVISCFFCFGCGTFEVPDSEDLVLNDFTKVKNPDDIFIQDDVKHNDVVDYIDSDDISYEDSIIKDIIDSGNILDIVADISVVDQLNLELVIYDVTIADKNEIRSDFESPLDSSEVQTDFIVDRDFNLSENDVVVDQGTAPLDYFEPVDFAREDVKQIDTAIIDVAISDNSIEDIAGEDTEQEDLLAVDFIPDTAQQDYVRHDFVREDQGLDLAVDFSWPDYQPVDSCPDDLPYDITYDATDPLLTGLVAWYKFDNNTLDFSGNDHHAFNNNASFTMGILDQCLDFVFIEQDYVGAPIHDDFSFTDGINDTAFSVSAWININVLSYFYVVSKGRSVDQNLEYAFYLDASGILTFELYSQNDQNFIGKSYDQAMSPYQARWAHVVATYDGSKSSSGIKLYVNGNRVDNVDTSTGNYTGMTADLTSANLARYGQLYSDGKIDDFRIYNRVVRHDEVIQMYYDATSILVDAGVQYEDVISSPGDSTSAVDIGECAIDDECELGTYCNADQQCVTDCFDHLDCDPGYMCNLDRGRCEPGYMCRINITYDDPSDIVTLDLEIDDELKNCLLESVEDANIRKVILINWETIMRVERVFSTPPTSYQFVFSLPHGELFRGILEIEDNHLSSVRFDLDRCQVIPADAVYFDSYIQIEAFHFYPEEL